MLSVVYPAFCDCQDVRTLLKFNLCLQLLSVDNLFKQFCTQIRSDKLSGQTLSQTVWPSDGVHE